MNSIKLTFWLLLISITAQAQSSVTTVTVPISLLKKHVYLLSSDSLQGRETGQRGQREAAIYCSRAFRQSRLTPFFLTDSASASFRQTYPFTATQVVPFGGANTAANRTAK